MTHRNRLAVLIRSLLVMVSMAIQPLNLQAQTLEVIDRIGLGVLDPFQISVSQLTNQTYIPGFESGVNTRLVGVVDNARGTLSLLPLGERAARGGIDANDRTGKVYLSLDQGPSPTPLLGIIDDGGTELTEIPIFGFRPASNTTFPGHRLLAVNDETGLVYLLGSDGIGTTLGVFDPALQELIVVPLYDLIQPSGIAVNSQTNRVYVSATATGAEGALGVFDGDSNSLTVVPFGGDLLVPISLAVNESTNTIYVGGRGANVPWAMAEVTGVDNTFEVIPLDDLGPLDIATIENTNQVLAIGVNSQSEGELRIFNATARTTSRIVLGLFSPFGVSVNQSTSLAYVVGSDFLGEASILVIGPLVCQSNITTLAELHIEVEALSTSEATRDDLASALKTVRRSLKRGNWGGPHSLDQNRPQLRWSLLG